MANADLVYQCRVSNWTNQNWSHIKLSQYKKKHRGMACLRMTNLISVLGGFKWPIKITLTRYGKRRFDEHDNLRSSFKPEVDGIADALGIRDDDPRVTWEYRQAPSTFYKVGIKIEEI